MARFVRLRMSEPKGHQQIFYSSAASDLTFAWRTRGNTDADVKSAALASRAKVKSTRVSHHRFTGQHRHSLRNGFTAYSALSPMIELCCHRRRNAKALSPFASFEASVARFPRFVRLSRPHFRELRKAKGNCNYLIPVPLTILKFLKGFAATSEELQNRRRWYHAAWPSARLSHAARGDQRPPHLPRVRGDREPPLLVGTG